MRALGTAVEMMTDDLDAGVGLTSAFQSIVSLANETVIGFEALTRWQHLVNPDPNVVPAHASTRAAPDALQCIVIREEAGLFTSGSEL